MFCKACGKQLPDGSVFCPGCGTKQDYIPTAAVPEPAAAAPAVTETSKTRKSLMPVNVVLALVLALLCVVSAVVIFKVKKDRDSSSSEGLKEYKIVRELPDGSYSGRSPVIEDPADIQGGSCEIDVVVEDGEVIECEPVLYDVHGVRKDEDYIKKLDEDKQEKVRHTIDAVVKYADQLEDTGDVEEVEPIEDAEIIYDQFKKAADDILEKANQGADAPLPEDSADDSKDESREDPFDIIPEPEPEPVDYGPEAEKYAKVVKDNESVWLEPFNSSDTVPQDYENPNCWFEDVDFDGSPEFIIGGFNMGTQGGIGYRIYRIDTAAGTLEILRPCWGDEEPREFDPVYGGGSLNVTLDYPNHVVPGFAGGGGELLRDADGELHYYFDYIASYIDEHYGFEEAVLDTSALTARTKAGTSYVKNTFDGINYVYTLDGVTYEANEFLDVLDERFKGWIHVENAHGGYIPCTMYRDVDPEMKDYYICGRYDDLSDADRLAALKQSCVECFEAEIKDTDEAPHNYTKLRDKFEEINPSYNSFADVVKAKEKQYGELVVRKDNFDGFSVMRSLGVMYINLLDMDGDGEDELLIGCIESDTSKSTEEALPPTLEMWAYKDGRARCMRQSNVYFELYGADSSKVVIYRDKSGCLGYFATVPSNKVTEETKDKYEMVKYKNGRLDPDYIDLDEVPEIISDASDRYSIVREDYFYMYAGDNDVIKEETAKLKKLVSDSRRKLGLEF